MRSCAVRVTILVLVVNIQPVPNFMELHALTQAACSHVVLM